MIDEHYLDDTVLLGGFGLEKRGGGLADLLGEFEQDVLADRDLLDGEGGPVMVGVRENSPWGKFVITDDISDLSCLVLVSLSQRNPHLLEELVDFKLSQSSLHKVQDPGDDVLVPVPQQLVFFDWRGLVLHASDIGRVLQIMALLILTFLVELDS